MWWAAPLAVVYDAERPTAFNWLAWAGAPVLSVSHVSAGYVVAGFAGIGLDARYRLVLITKGDLRDQEAVARAVRGHHGVLVAIDGSRLPGTRPDARSLGTANIVVSAGYGALLPARGFRDIFRTTQPAIPGFTTPGALFTTAVLGALPALATPLLVASAASVCPRKILLAPARLSLPLVRIAFCITHAIPATTFCSTPQW